MLQALPRLRFLISVGKASAQLDRSAVLDHDAELLELSDIPARRESDAQNLCNRITRAIDNYLLGADGAGQTR